MADGDTAFNPDIPEAQRWGLQPETQVAQAPAQPMPELPQRPSMDWNAPAPAPPPAPSPGGQGDQPTALTTGVKPPPDDVNEVEELKAADLDEEQRYARELRSHRGNYDILHDTVDPKANPLYPKLERAQQIFNTMDKAGRARWKPQIDSLARQIMAETKTQNDKVKADLKVQTIQADAPYENTTQRERTAGTIGEHINDVVIDQTAKAQDRDPKIAQQGEFNVTVSPLSTMAAKKRDGTVDYGPLRDAATSIATLNGRMQPDVAVRHVMMMATPMGWDDDGKPLTGFNGKRGQGARTYQVIGRDIRDNYLVLTQDGTHLRIDPDTMQTIRQAQGLGYKAGLKLLADRKKVENTPDWWTRNITPLIPKKGF